MGCEPVEDGRYCGGSDKNTCVQGVCAVNTPPVACPTCQHPVDGACTAIPDGTDCGSAGVVVKQCLQVRRLLVAPATGGGAPCCRGRYMGVCRCLAPPALHSSTQQAQRTGRERSPRSALFWTLEKEAGAGTNKGGLCLGVQGCRFAAAAHPPAPPPLQGFCVINTPPPCPVCQQYDAASVCTPSPDGTDCGSTQEVSKKCLQVHAPPCAVAMLSWAVRAVLGRAGQRARLQGSLPLPAERE